jgi:hypothetical protein
MIFGKPMPQAEIDTLLPAMLEIEWRLEAECGLPNLIANIEESCSGAKCSKQPGVAEQNAPTDERAVCYCTLVLAPLTAG